MRNRLIPVILVLAIAAGAIIAGYFILDKPMPLPVLQPADVNPDLVPDDLEYLKKGHSIGDFSLVDQHGKEITFDHLQGKIVLADFFFVTCPTICPKMAEEMKNVWEEFKDDPAVLFVSHTVMPEEDTPEILSHYADSLGVNGSNWIFLTGSKKEIYRLARRSYMVTATEGIGDEEDFIHTENFALVDQLGRIRAYYDGTNPEDTEKAIRDIKSLKEEQKRKK